MTLAKELGFNKGFDLLAHEAVLNIYYTASKLKKRADEFFRDFGLTDVQFNLMMLLQHQSPPRDGLTQAELSRMMLVNRANITSLIDRMEKAGMVVRTAASNDRRYNIVKLTPVGKKLLTQAEPLYAKLIKKTITCLKQPEQKELIKMLEKIRTKLP